MKTALVLIVLALASASGVFATTVMPIGFFPVSPQGTFLYNAPGDNCGASYAPLVCSMSAEVINLFNYGVQIGDTINITDVGGLCITGGASAGCTVYPASSSYLGGIFATSGVVDPVVTDVDRVTDSVNAGLPDIFNNSNLNALANGQNTTIPNDFYLAASPGTTVVVPAQYLIVGTLDSAFADNGLGTSPGFFGVDITDLTFSSTAPEPGTAALLVTGIVGLWGFRRKFVNRA